MSKIKEKNLSVEDLNLEILKNKDELKLTRFNISIGEESNTSKVNKIRKTIARLNTKIVQAGVSNEWKKW